MAIKINDIFFQAWLGNSQFQKEMQEKYGETWKTDVNRLIEEMEKAEERLYKKLCTNQTNNSCYEEHFAEYASHPYIFLGREYFYNIISIQPEFENPFVPGGLEKLYSLSLIQECFDDFKNDILEEALTVPDFVVEYAKNEEEEKNLRDWIVSNAIAYLKYIYEDKIEQNITPSLANPLISSALGEIIATGERIEKAYWDWKEKESKEEIKNRIEFLKKELEEWDKDDEEERLFISKLREERKEKCKKILPIVKKTKDRKFIKTLMSFIKEIEVD